MNDESLNEVESQPKTIQLCIEMCCSASTLGEEPISVQVRAVANLCKGKYDNIFFQR